MTKLAFVFPGQGSQQVGMLADFFGQYPQVDETFAEASDVLGYDMKALVLDGPVEELSKTEKTQPALVTASTALYRAWSSKQDAEPSLFAGHSLGEYSALVASGVMSFADTVKIVELRGQLMQQAVPAGQGLMAAILGLTDEQVVEGCAKAAEGEVVSAVNFNTPGQVVIAGQKAAVERAIEILKAMGAKRAMPLAVSVPSHCALMEPAAEKLAVAFEEITFNAPSAPIVQNRVAQAVTDVAQIRKNLLEQLYQPVQWTKSVEFMAAQGITEIIECGPGKVLSGLNRRIAKELTHTALGDLASFEKRVGA
ncbi:ACP S-malonyltransferase [Reinekea marinisedimentorum]|uniref:Malonyl CoA-acyl carrier protein transacylase n=1 Tax=Reinekea marinisedimentorum TaxID=230495 RepID=A0A4R3IAN5_9GAMM|nr:ACP S-malonyltransferase [Reinekea marinisedimentorum]TCS42559.1 [acyl-carrier-protein] S-malonyltransferase [Reinekea marinisedimentorum]